MPIFNARQITPEKSGPFFDVALRESFFGSDYLQSMPYDIFQGYPFQLSEGFEDTYNTTSPWLEDRPRSFEMLITIRLA